MLLLLEHDAKTVLASEGFPVPQGRLVDLRAGGGVGFEPPCIVKAQVPTGGRGKAGGIRRVEDASELRECLSAFSSLKIGPHAVREVRLEAPVEKAAELYFGLSVDPSEGRLLVMASANGGIDVEANADDGMAKAHAFADILSLRAAVDAVAAELPGRFRDPVRTLGRQLAEFFLRRDATLLEINPLFVTGNGSCIIGDARLAIDESALPRQSELDRLLTERSAAYRDAIFKRDHGYDLVVVDPGGTVGLVTTGAGLSMKLIDEMSARSIRAYNFCDIRSGMMRGDPARLIEAFRRVSEGPDVRCVLVNIFAGITDLAEFAQSLIEARDALPGFDLPMVVRLAGNNEDRADALLRESSWPFRIERDLDRALDDCARIAGAHA